MKKPIKPKKPSKPKRPPITHTVTKLIMSIGDTIPVNDLLKAIKDQGAYPEQCFIDLEHGWDQTDVNKIPWPVLSEFLDLRVMTLIHGQRLSMVQDLAINSLGA